MGGSLAHADPSAELPAAMVALDATFTLRSAASERRMKAAEFFTGLFATALSPGELMVGVEIPPRAPRGGSAFLEVARRHGGYALCGGPVPGGPDNRTLCPPDAAISKALFADS